MDNETPQFPVEEPYSSDHLDAAEILFNHDRAEEFFENLTQHQFGWSVTFTRSGQAHTLRAETLSALALAFINFSPERERRRQDQALAAAAAKQKAERAAEERKANLTRALLGGAS